MTRAEQALLNNAVSAARSIKTSRDKHFIGFGKNAFTNCDTCPFYVKCNVMFDNGTIMFCHDAVEYFFTEMEREAK